jgi:hypothetical protein
MMTHEEARALFKTERCWCGGHKKVTQSVCSRCWWKLDSEQRDSLYQRIGKGFEEAYEAAIEFLRRTAARAGGGR